MLLVCVCVWEYGRAVTIYLEQGGAGARDGDAEVGEAEQRVPGHIL